MPSNPCGRSAPVAASVSAMKVAACCCTSPAIDVRSDNADGIELFTEADFGGERFATGRDVSALDRGNFNDRAASAIVYSGQWEFCVDFDYRGACAVYGPGRYPRLGGLTRQLSSVRRLQ